MAEFKILSESESLPRKTVCVRVIRKAGGSRGFPSAAHAIVTRRGRVLPRPSRVLRHPEPLFKQGNRLMLNHGDPWVIRKWQGPERIASGGWDEEEGLDRDYYCVTTDTGEKLWIYLDRSNPQNLYLHGYFD